MRLQLFALAMAIVLFAAACAGSSDDADNEALRAQIAALQAQLDTAENRSDVEQRLEALEEQLTSPEASSAATPAAAARPSTPEPTAVAVAPRTRYVASTGGVGVSVRSACRDSARTGARGWPESTVLQVEYVGTNACEGWVLARLGAGGTTSWIRERCLSETRPVVARSTSTPAGTATPARTPSCSIASSSQMVIASTVKVLTVGGFGTAFYMGDSEFITAAHVVKGYSSVQLEAPGLSVVAQIVGFSSSADVAVLRATTSLTPLQWGNSSALAAGQSVAVAGYPQGFATSAAVSTGVVSRGLLSSSGQRVIQTDAAVSPGNSGGPAFDECGRVIGMVTSKIVDTAVEGVAFAIAEDSVRAALPDARAHPLIECGTPTLNVAAGQTTRWGWEVLPVGSRVYGEFSVELRTSGDLLDIRFYLEDQPGDVRQRSLGEFEFWGSSAGAHVIVFDNSYSVLTSKNITINWCAYG